MRGLHWALVSLALVLGAAGGTVVALYLRPLPALAATTDIPLSEQLGPAVALPWPSTGSAAVRVPGLGWLGQTPATPHPMASTAKIMTALIILEDHPLALGQAGPLITVTPADVTDYRRQVARDQSSVPVAAGERLSELQLLQGLLIPSASNFADILATWDAGSVPAFVQRMNQRAAALGMTQSHYVDATGFDPGTVSVPADLVMVAEAALGHPVFAQIVDQSTVVLPLSGTLPSTDHILGQAGIIGIKTGHTDQAGGNFVFATMLQIGGRPIRVDGAVMNQPSLDGAFAVTLTLIRAMAPHVRLATVVQPSDPVATIRAAWHVDTRVHPVKAVSLLVFDGMRLRRAVRLVPVIAPVPSHTIAGWLTVELGDQRAEVPVETQTVVPPPGALWRIIRR